MGEILNHLFEMVLEDASLNDKKRLLSIVSEQFTDVKMPPKNIKLYQNTVSEDTNSEEIQK